MKSNTKQKRKWLKIVLTVAAVLGITVVILSAILQNLVSERFKRIDNLSFKKIETSLLSGCLDIHEFEVQHFNDNLHPISVKSSIGHIHGFNYWKYFRNDQVIIKKILLEELQIESLDSLKQDTQSIQNNTSLKNSFTHISVGEFQITNGKINLKTKTGNHLIIDSLSTTLDEITYTPSPDSAKLHWNTTILNGHQIKINNEDFNNYLTIENLHVSIDNEVDVTNLRWIPKRGKLDFIEPLPYRKARTDILIPHINISSFSLSDYILNNRIISPAITVSDATFDVFVNKTKAFCPDCQKEYFYEELTKINCKIDVDSIFVKNSKVFLEEKTIEDVKPGQLDWSNVYASIYNLSNINTDKPYTSMDMKADFINTTEVKLHLRFPNIDPQKDYHFSGNMGAVNLNEFNRFLIFANQVRIKSGDLESLSFEGRGNLKVATGEMKMVYNNLKIEMLDKTQDKKTIMTGLANLFVRNKNNPDNKNELRVGKIYSERSTNKPFISNWWYAIRSGAQSSVLKNSRLPEELEVD